MAVHVAGGSPRDPVIVRPGDPRDAHLAGRGSARFAGRPDYVRLVRSTEDVITTCEYRPEYACYQSATCTAQADGQCGWTMTPELAYVPRLTVFGPAGPNFAPL